MCLEQFVQETIQAGIFSRQCKDRVPLIGKAGYSTVAEAYRVGIPFGYVPREKFREAATMAKFIRAALGGFEISSADFESGRWIARLPDLLALPRLTRREPNGAQQIADFVLGN